MSADWENEMNPSASLLLRPGERQKDLNDHRGQKGQSQSNQKGSMVPGY